MMNTRFLGPALVALTTLLPWPAFADALGEGSAGLDGGVNGAVNGGVNTVALGLYVGAVSITLMAWSFLLAVRVRWLEPLFGGLDSMYKAHRWAGSLAVAAMFAHTSIEPEIEGGIAGASENLADLAEELAGAGEVMLYGLVGVSLLRVFPYRWWRLTHKLLGVPFALASAHFFTAEKPYANASGWGIYYGTIMVVGLAAYLWRVVGRDMLSRGRSYEVASVSGDGTTLDLRLASTGPGLKFTPGQFSVLKVQRSGLSEPHPFTIASAPAADHLRFHIRDLGDWSGRVQTELKVGDRVLVEGPYGRFDPGHRGDRPVVWVAGGVGITPFLSAIGELNSTVESAPTDRPVLIYCVRRWDDATARAEIEAAADSGKVRLVVVESESGDRLDHERLVGLFGPDGLKGHHVAACGPDSLVSMVRSSARTLGAGHVESEEFDIRAARGPSIGQAAASVPKYWRWSRNLFRTPLQR